MKKIVILIIAVIISASFLFSQSDTIEWKKTKFWVEGDSMFFVKYRERFVADTGLVFRTVRYKWKGKNIRCTDTNYRNIITIPEQEEEQ